MTPELRRRITEISRKRIQLEKLRRAEELIAFADVHGIEIGFEIKGGEEMTTFKPYTIDPRFIEEVTILSREVKFVLQKLKRL